MIETVSPGSRSGLIEIPASKSQAHRLLLCAALSEAPGRLLLRGWSEDLRATVQCLSALGASFSACEGGVCLTPVHAAPSDMRTLDAGESGSTLRFLLPVLGAMGVHATVRMHGRLPQRPLGALAEQLRQHGMSLRQADDCLFTSGRLTPGKFNLPGDVSSQFVSGLLFALPLLDADSTLHVTGPLQSASYVAMTEQALHQAQIHFSRQAQTWCIPGRQRYRLPAQQRVEGDWSNAAFFLCMGALSAQGITVTGLSPTSLQADRAIVELLTRFGAEVHVTDAEVHVRRRQLRGITLDAGPIPDLIPVVSVLAAFAEGQTTITNAARLRLKESDRLQTTAQLITALGGTVQELPDGLIITGSASLRGGTVDACGDHRIAMSAAVAACGCETPVIVTGSECVSKSYPAFWQDLARLKGGSI